MNPSKSNLPITTPKDPIEKKPTPSLGTKAIAFPYFLFGLSVIAVFFGALLKILHLPFGNILLVIGLLAVILGALLNTLRHKA